MVTDDLGVLRLGEDCGCGINSPYLTILGRVGMPEIQTCAAGAAELLWQRGGILVIFAAGALLSQEELPALLDSLEERLNETRSGPPLDVDVVLDAVDSLGRTLDSGELAPLLAQYAPPGAREELREVRGMLRREALEARLQLELGDLRPGVWVERPFGRTLVQPLGVLLHVTPGNQVGIPLFSALEGLLTGNLNLIKLPHGDRGADSGRPEAAHPAGAPAGPLAVRL